MIYGHGDDLYLHNNVKINFSSNVKPGGIGDGLKQHLKNSISDCIAYPEPKAKELELCIEEKFGLQQRSVLVTNGAVEAFYMIAAWKKKRHSLVFYPSFSEYEDACAMYRHRLDFAENTELLRKTEYTQDVVWLCNPNNPDGKVFDPGFLKEIIECNKNTLFVLDEAYVDFVEENISLVESLNHHKNLIIIRSLTKRFVIPGLRLGYMMAAPEIIKELEKMIIPWRINMLAQKAGLHCLNNLDDFDLPKLLKESKRLQNEINRIDGFSVEASNTSFFLVKSKWKAAELKKVLAKKHGMLIRDASNFRGLGEYHFRIASQLPHQNNELIKALGQWK